MSVGDVNGELQQAANILRDNAVNVFGEAEAAASRLQLAKDGLVQYLECMEEAQQHLRNLPNTAQGMAGAAQAAHLLLAQATEGSTRERFHTITNTCGNIPTKAEDLNKGREKTIQDTGALIGRLGVQPNELDTLIAAALEIQGTGEDLQASAIDIADGVIEMSSRL